MTVHDPLQHSPRLLIEATLRPVQGARFQPTGFPDLGPAVFEAPDGTRLLVESVQSMANRMEAVCWDKAENELIAPLRGLSYVRVERDGAYLTSSIEEAHRLSSPYILDNEQFFEVFKEATLGADTGPVAYRRVAEAMLRYDVCSLIHGVFLAEKKLAGGRMRIQRALSGFIEARGVRVAASGGVKMDHVNPQGAAKDRLGHIPFQRDEHTAEEITAYFNIDLAQIRGYGLGAEVEDLLVHLAMYKIRAFLDSGLRLRTACDLELDGEPRVTRPEGFSLPGLGVLREVMPRLIAACASQFAGQGGITRVRHGA